MSADTERCPPPAHVIPLAGHYGLAHLVGEAITRDVDAYDIGRDEHFTTLLVDWQGEQYVLTVERKQDAEESCPITQRGYR